MKCIVRVKSLHTYKTDRGQLAPPALNHFVLYTRQIQNTNIQGFSSALLNILDLGNPGHKIDECFTGHRHFLQKALYKSRRSGFDGPQVELIDFIKNIIQIHR